MASTPQYAVSYNSNELTQLILKDSLAYFGKNIPNLKENDFTCPEKFTISVYSGPEEKDNYVFFQGTLRETEYGITSTQKLERVYRKQALLRILAKDTLQKNGKSIEAPNINTGYEHVIFVTTGDAMKHPPNEPLISFILTISYDSSDDFK